jgi:hypothetical protein
MTRKHFETIARRVSNRLTTETDQKARHAVWLLALDIADDLANANPRFDRDRFVKACEPKA